MSLRSTVASVVPVRLRRWRNAVIADRAQRRLEQLPTDEIFASIYAEGHWGRSGDGNLYSGLGSHDDTIVGPYVAAVRRCLEGFETPPDAVDLGCGDFNVGSQPRDRCGAYVACDVAKNVIEHDIATYGSSDVDFRVVDMSADPLPAGDVVFVRQVLQHLSNDQIAAVLPKLRDYRVAIITEHLPAERDFEPNVDIATGLKIRTAVGSGVVLEAPPFSFAATSAEELCVVRHETGTIVTTAYRFDD